MRKLLSYLITLTFFISCLGLDTKTDDQLANEINQEVEKNIEEEEEKKKVIEDELKKKREWQIKYYVDDFGDKTDKGFLFKNIEDGKFSNSATNSSELVVNFLIEPDKLAIMLYEYGNNIVNGSSKYPTSYNVKVKNDDQVFEFTGKNYGDRLQFDSDENKKLIDIIDSSQRLKFSIIEINDYAPSKYQFTLNNGAGLKQKFENI